MGFDDKILGNMTAIFSTVYNCFFIFLTGDQLHLIGGALGLVFTAILNLRRTMREINQLYLIFKAKTQGEADKLLQQDLEPDKKEE